MNFFIQTFIILFVWKFHLIKIEWKKECRVDWENSVQMLSLHLYLKIRYLKSGGYEIFSSVLFMLSEYSEYHIIFLHQIGNQWKKIHEKYEYNYHWLRSLWPIWSGKWLFNKSYPNIFRFYPIFIERNELCEYLITVEKIIIYCGLIFLIVVLFTILHYISLFLE